MRHFCIRVDGSASIGGGHLSRCLTLANELTAQGHAVHFFTAGEEGYVRPRVEIAGYNLTILNCAMRPPVKDGEEPFNDELVAQDAAASLAAIASQAQLHGGEVALVVDHYGLDHRWERQLRSVAHSIIVLDDLANRPHSCDILVDAAPRSAGDYRSLVDPSTRLLLGPAYALLRGEFREHTRAIVPRHGIGRALVSFGATDPGGHAHRAVAALRGALGAELFIDCTTARGSPQLEALQALAARDPNLAIHIDASNMAELMAKADIAIGAGGVTGWERAALGLPSIMLVLAENQRPTARAIAEGGAGLILESDANEAEIGSLAKLVHAQPALLTCMSKAGPALCDGRGAIRVARAIAPPSIVCRPAVEADSQWIWSWRNSPGVRETALDQNEIPWQRHEAWFIRQLNDRLGALLVAEEAGNARAVLRYDTADGQADEAAVSIYLDPDLRGRGIGPAVLAAGERWLRANRPCVVRLLATVKHDNAPSRRLFEGADYRPFSILHRKEITP